MNMRLTSLACATLAFWLAGTVACHADPVEGELEAAFVQAYESNPTLRAARAELYGVDETVPQALSGWRPTVTASGSFSSSRTDPGGFGTQNGEVESMELRVTQPIFRGGRTVAGTREAESTVRAQRALLHSTEQAVLLDAVTAYMSVYLAQQVLALRENNEKVLEKQLEAAEYRFEYGELTRTDVSQAEARLAAAKAARIDAEGDLRARHAFFEQIIGPVPEEDLGAPVIDLGLPHNLGDAVVRAEAANPGVVLADHLEKASGESIKTARGELLPSVDLVGSVTRTWNPVFAAGSPLDVSTVAVEASVPLYASGATRSRIRQAKHVENQRRMEILGAQRNAKQQAVEAWERLVAAEASIKARRAQVESAALALEGVQEEALAGSRTTLDVLDAEQEHLDARVDLVTAEHDVVLAKFRLLSATGGLTAEFLDLDTELFDPEEHLDDVRYKMFGTGVDSEY